MTGDRIDVLYLTHNYPRGPGDFAGRFVARLAELTDKQGLSVGVLAPHHPGATERETVNGVRVHRFRYAQDEDEIIAYRGELGRVSLLGSSGLFAYRRFWRAFKQNAANLTRECQPRVIHAHWWLPAGMIARSLPFDGPLIVTLHGTDLRLLQRKSWLRPFASRVFRRARAVTLVSSWLADTLTETFPWLSAKITVSPMPPDDGLFTPASEGKASAGPPVILCVTRFTEQKRNAVLLEALSRMRDRGTEFRARLIGNGPLRSRIQERVKASPLADWVTIGDPVPQSELAHEYRGADLVVLPAVDEGFGMALVEAQFCGTAVVGVRSGGITDIIVDGDSGLLAAPDDPEDLAVALTRTLSDRTMRDRLARNGLMSARERFSSSAIVDRFRQLYTTE